jgi:hypothetical protein
MFVAVFLATYIPFLKVNYYTELETPDIHALQDSVSGPSCFLSAQTDFKHCSHPNIVQLYGVAKSSSIYAAVFHDGKFQFWYRH